MRFLMLSFILLLIPEFGSTQTGDVFIVIGELRKGKNGKKIVPYKKFDGAEFYQIVNSEDQIVEGVSAKLVEKEEYYDPEIVRGTEIRFYIPRKLFKGRMELRIKGELYNKLSGEVIRGRLKNELVIKLKEDNRIGLNTYKLDKGINLKEPAKFTLTSEINYLNGLLFEDSLSFTNYTKEVSRISLEENNGENYSKEFLKSCYKIYELVEPHFSEQTYFPFEKEELDKHIERINSDLSAIYGGTYTGSESLDSLRRDSLESNLVATEYLKLMDRMLPLKNKIESIIFEAPNRDTKPKNNECNKNIDFKIVPAVSFSRDSLYFNRYSENGELIEMNENKLTFSLICMTNFYLSKRSKPVNPAISLGIGANFQGSDINLGAFFGGGLFFGKNRSYGFNLGVSYLPIEGLIPGNLDMGPMIRNDDYNWFPFIATTIPIHKIFRTSPSNEVKGED